MLRLREIRKNRNLSQVELAKLAGVPQSYISELESGISKPGLETLVKLTKALDCKLDDLVDVEAVS